MGVLGSGHRDGVVPWRAIKVQTKPVAAEAERTDQADEPEVDFQPAGRGGGNPGRRIAVVTVVDAGGVVQRRGARQHTRDHRHRGAIGHCGEVLRIEVGADQLAGARQWIDDGRAGKRRGRHERRGSEQAAEVVQREADGFDRSVGRLEAPVAAEEGRAGAIGRGRHIGTGQIGQQLDEGLPDAAGGDVATIEQQVAAGRQGTADGGQPVRVVRQRGAIEAGAAEHQAACRAV